MAKEAKLSGERLAQYISDAVKDALGPERAEKRNEENEIQRRYGVGEVMARRAGESGHGSVRDLYSDDNPFTAQGAHSKSVPNRHVNGAYASKSYWDMEDKDVAEMDANERSLMAARMIGFIYRAGNNTAAAAEMAQRTGHYLTAKALAASVLSGGGAMLPVEFASGVIELLEAMSVLAGMTQRAPMPNGSLTLPYVDTGSSATWVGENQTISPTQPTFGQLQLSAKKLAALVPTSNDLLRFGGALADQTIRNDLARAMREQLDVTLIRGLGTAYAPKGLRGWVKAANTFNANASTTVATVTNDLTNMQFLLENNNIPMDSARYRFSPRTKNYLRALRTGTVDVKAFPEVERGELLGLPFSTTTQIPTNLGGGSDESEIYLSADDQLVLGDSQALTIEAFPGGAYYDGSNVQSGISNDQTPIRALWQADFGDRRRGDSIALMEQVDWAVV